MHNKQQAYFQSAMHIAGPLLLEERSVFSDSIWMSGSDLKWEQVIDFHYRFLDTWQFAG